MTPAANNEPGTAEIELPESITREDVETFVAPLTDAQARQLLLVSLAKQAIDSTAAESGEDRSRSFSSILENIRAGSSGAIENAAALSEALPQTGDAIGHAFILLTDLQGWPRMLAGIGNLIMMIVAGLIAAALVGRFLTGFVDTQVAIFKPTSRRDKVLALMLRAATRVGQLIVFIVVGHSASLLIFDRFDPMRLFLIGWFGAIAVGGGAHVLARLLFAPTLSDLRIPDISDLTAKHLTYWLVGSATIAAFFAFNAGMFALLAIPPVLILVWKIFGGLLVFLLTHGAIRRTVTNGGSQVRDSGNTFSSLVARSVAPRLRVLLTTTVALLFVVWAARTFAAEERSAAATLLVGFAFATAWYVRRIGMGQSSANDHRDDADTGSTAAVFSAAFVVIGIVALIQALALDLVALMQTPVGQQVGNVLLKIGITLLIAAIIWTVISHVISRFIEREQDKAQAEMGDVPEDSEGGSAVVSSRLGTLLPIFRGFTLAVLLIITLMIVLSSIGIDIGPLLAGAGVIGIAIGFGAQALVKDILSGIFFLIDDAFRVGEYIEFAEYRGEVERISIRSMRLRHHRGPVQTIPFGELLVVTNHNRDWIIYKQEFQVPYEADIEKIRKIVKRIGQELLEDPVHGPNFLAPLKSQGVRRVENGVLVIGTKFMCKPREQFVLRRVVYQRVRDALYENGIELAHRRVQIELPGTVDDKGSEMVRAAGATQAALDEEEVTAQK